MTNAELSLKTKKSLAAALKKAMKTKKLSKITVSELVAECNINRKTFYYHFSDIYDLLKWMFEEEAIEVIKQFDMVVNTEEALRFIMDYVESNDHIINCAYDSLGHEELKRFFYTDIYDIMRNVIIVEAKRQSLNVDDNFMDFLASFYTEGLSGMLIYWIKNNLPQEKETVLQNMLLISRVTISQVLKAKSKQNN